MSLFVTALNSGSNGNCYYVGNSQEAVLIDAGISCRETEQRMKRLELSMHKVKAIFVSHEHTDHVRGVYRISKKYNIPIYVTEGTLQKSPFGYDNPLNKIIQSYEKISIGNLQITAFPKFHDANDPHSFIIEQDDLCVGVFTDIGEACTHVVDNFKKCHAIFLEANYDTDMLMNGPYPYYLKNRIRSGRGHLSNKQALDLFLEHRSEGLSHVFLSHLSKENNDPQLALDLFKSHSNGVEIILTSRYEEIPVYTISGSKFLKDKIETQLNLF